MEPDDPDAWRDYSDEPANEGEAEMLPLFIYWVG